jgi:xanthosine utilization system XapX-like protein
MIETTRPVSILILACVYLAVGSIGFVYHFSQLRQPEGVWIALTELLAILCGAFMLRGQNWARWLALAWIAFHVILSAFRALPELAMHTLLFAVIAWFLFRPEARRYFRSAKAPS